MHKNVRKRLFEFTIFTHSRKKIDFLPVHITFILQTKQHLNFEEEKFEFPHSQTRIFVYSSFCTVLWQSNSQLIFVLFFISFSL